MVLAIRSSLLIECFLWVRSVLFEVVVSTTSSVRTSTEASSCEHVLDSTFDFELRRIWSHRGIETIQTIHGGGVGYMVSLK